MGGDRGGRGSGPPHENHKLPLFLRRKTGTNLPREAIRPPLSLELSGFAHTFLTGILFFAYSRFSYQTFLEIIGRTAQLRWLICAFFVCIQKSFSRKWVKKPSCKFKYTDGKREAFRPFFLICCGVSGTISLTLDMHLHLHSLYVSIYAPGKTVRMCRLV